MSFIYTRAQLKSDINRGIFGKIGMLIDEDDTCNEVVRAVNSDMDLRSLRRRAVLAPNLYNGINDYAAPADLDAGKIVDIPAQAKRQDGEFFLVPPEEFDIHKPVGAIAIDDFNGTRVLKINSSVNSHSVTISELDSLVSGLSSGNWSLFGDATSLAADEDDFIKGSGSIKWNISAAGGTTAGIQCSTVSSLDMTDYFGGTSSFFIWHKITSTTNITNYILRFGTDSSNYYYKTVTTQFDGTAFVNGWNLLKFDVASYSTTGTPTDTDIKYYAIYMTKAAGKVSESDYKFDWLVLKRGVVSYVKYYSKYGWQTSGGTYIENSTADSDLLVADKDEYNIIVEKGREIAGFEVKEFEASGASASKYQAKKKEYQMMNPSNAKIISSSYYEYGNIPYNGYGGGSNTIL